MQRVRISGNYRNNGVSYKLFDKQTHSTVQHPFLILQRFLEKLYDISQRHSRGLFNEKQTQCLLCLRCRSKGGNYLIHIQIFNKRWNSRGTFL